MVGERQSLVISHCSIDVEHGARGRSRRWEGFLIPLSIEHPSLAGQTPANKVHGDYENTTPTMQGAGCIFLDTGGTVAGSQM